MHDVVGHVVVAVADEDLLAKDLVAAIVLRLGARADEGEVGAGLRLGQVHGAGPFAGDHLFQVGRLQFIACTGEQGFNGTRGEQGTEREAEVGRTHHFLHRDAERAGQALAAVFGGQRDAAPAGLAEGVIGLLPAVRGSDAFRRPGATLGVADAVERGKHFAGEFGSFVEDGIGHVRGCIGVGRKLAELLEAGNLIHHEAHVLDRGAVVAH